MKKRNVWMLLAVIAASVVILCGYMVRDREQTARPL